MRFFRKLAVSVLAATGMVMAASGAATAAPDSGGGDLGTNGLCEARWYYTVTSGGPTGFTAVTPLYGNYNGTPYTATSTFIATTTDTVTTTVTGKVGVTVNTVVANVNATFGISGSTAIATTYGVQQAIQVPAYRTGHGQYGVYYKTAYGRSDYYNSACTVTASGANTAYVTWYTGWNTWIA